MFNGSNWDENSEMGFSLQDLIKKVNTPETKAKVQAAIDKNKQNLINFGIAKGTDAAGSFLKKTGAANPQAQALVNQFVGSATAAAQDSFMEKNKMYFYAAGGLALAGIVAVIYMKRKKA